MASVVSSSDNGIQFQQAKLLNLMIFVNLLISVTCFGGRDVDSKSGPGYRNLLQAHSEFTKENNMSMSTRPDSLFPESLFTEEQLRHGSVILYVIGVIYLFIALIMLCNQFFVPSIYIISQKLSIPKDVAGATFMAGGVLVPGLLVSFIGVFKNSAYASVGSIVGSSAFNILFVTSMCAFLSKSQLTISPWSLLRDLGFYVVSLILLVVFFLDDNVSWYESLILFLVYISYSVFMAIRNKMSKRKGSQVGSTFPLESVDGNSVTTHGIIADADQLEDDLFQPINLEWPTGCKNQASYILKLPAIFPLWLTLPDSSTRRGKRFFVWTFLGSILWMVLISYLMVWWSTVLAFVFQIPNQIMAMTIFGIGSPGLITSVIVARNGFGDMALAAANGRNIFEICVSLPLPWLVYFLVNAINGENNNSIYVSSDGMGCSVLLLIVILVSTCLVIVCSKWKLTRCLGVFLLCLYVMFVAISLAFAYNAIACPV